MMKKIVIIGASGFVGSAILNEALTRGYQVEAIVRNPGNITIKNPGLQTIEGDIMNEDELVRLLSGKKAVISAYNPGWKNPHIYEDTLKGYSTLINASKRAGVKRLLIVGGAGSLLVATNKTVIDSGAIPESILPGVKSLAKVYSDYLIPEKSIDWVFFSPAGDIAPGKRTGKYRLGKNNLIVNDKGESKISVEDYAMAMINELEKPAHHRERFTIGY